MTADLVARLEAAANEVVADWHRSMGLPFPNTGSARQQVDLLREAASALRSSGEAAIPDTTEILGMLRQKWASYGLTEDEQKSRAFDTRMDMLLMAECRAALRPATPASAWRPIAEAPRGCSVLLWDGNGAVSGRWYAGETWNADYSITEWVEHPTHWMPLPTTPTSAKA